MKRVFLCAEELGQSQKIMKHLLHDGTAPILPQMYELLFPTDSETKAISNDQSRRKPALALRRGVGRGRADAGHGAADPHGQAAEPARAATQGIRNSQNGGELNE